jgi:hypothetical protein
MKALHLLGNIKAELKLIIAGNHDISLDKDYFLVEGGQIEEHRAALEIMTGSLAETMGVTYLEEGVHQFELKNGAQFSVYASPYTPRDPLSPSGFQYGSSEDRFSAPESSRPAWAETSTTGRSVIPLGVEIVMTHGPPRYVLDKTHDGQNAGCEHLRRAIIAAKPLLHCFGHIHSGWGAERVAWKGSITADEIQELELTEGDEEMILIREFYSRGRAQGQGYAEIPLAASNGLIQGRQTLFINAAIDPDENLKPRNAPWLVHLRLSKEGR